MRKSLKRVVRTTAFRAQGHSRFAQRLYHPLLMQALDGFRPESDISDHLSTMFFFALDARPRFIVELGTRGGESTRALLAAARACDVKMLSIDIEDVSAIEIPFRDRWTFIQADDVEFGKGPFQAWCGANGLEPEIDLLFIDTSHLYEHTKQELAVWTPLLSARGTMMLHDTNMGDGMYARLDGSIGIGWDNQRGVIRAVEELIGRTYDESAFFDDCAGGYLIKHFPNCSGLTVLKKTAIRT